MSEHVPGHAIDDGPSVLPKGVAIARRLREELQLARTTLGAAYDKASNLAFCLMMENDFHHDPVAYLRNGKRQVRKLVALLDQNLYLVPDVRAACQEFLDLSEAS